MPTNLNAGNTHPVSWNEPSGPCVTCPGALAIASNLNLQDHDLGETGSTPVNAHIESFTDTGGNTQRRLVLS